MHIPIQNIYYLLCYAWNKLDEKDKVSVEITEKMELLDLFAKVLIQGTRMLLKRGIDKNYQGQEVELAGIKGKLLMSDTLKRGLHLKQRAVCNIDEFSADILSNQLLVSTLIRLMNAEGLDKNLKAEIKPLLWMFPPITQVHIQSNLFRQVSIHRNNQFYRFLLNVCELIYENSLPTENPGEWSFLDFRRDERKMNQLFEAFLKNFYKRELSNWRVKGEHIYWQFQGNEKSDLDFLPRMETDISLENDNKKIIIDAKYYREALSSRYGNEKIKSGNIYQLFSYLLNQEDGSAKTLKAKGILLYPTVEKEIDLAYSYKDHPIEIRTVDLAQDWKLIEEKLLEIVKARS